MGKSPAMPGFFWFSAVSAKARGFLAVPSAAGDSFAASNQALGGNHGKCRHRVTVFPRLRASRAADSAPLKALLRLARNLRLSGQAGDFAGKFIQYLTGDRT
ncbi:MAG TPA: hypothetical protein VF254_11710 [Gammaproteobacteria bacterium]